MKKILTIGLILLISIFWVPTAFADATEDAEGETASTADCTTDDTGASFNVNCLAVTDADGNAIQTSALSEDQPAMQIVLNAVVFITKIVGSIAILILVIAGLLMITSMHKEQQITRAKEMFVGALIGIIITFTAYILATFVQSLFYT